MSLPTPTKNLGITILMLLLMLSFSSSLVAQNNAGNDERQQVGIRFGGWINQGGLPVDTSPMIQADVGNSNFYAELYGAWNVFKRGYIELSLGFGNRGDVTVLDLIPISGTLTEVQYIGSLVIYPIIVQLKYYLPGFNRISFKPYVEAGGGLYIGRHSVTFTNSYYTYRQEPSSTSFNYAVSAGFDWPLASSIGLEMNTRYLPINFGGEGLFNEKDYSAVTVTVGVKYMFIPTKKKHGQRPNR